MSITCDIHYISIKKIKKKNCFSQCTIIKKKFLKILIYKNFIKNTPLKYFESGMNIYNIYIHNHRLFPYSTVANMEFILITKFFISIYKSILVNQSTSIF